MNKLNKFTILAVLSLFLFGCGGGGGGGDDGIDFPTPTLPAGARTIDADNAEETANLAVEFLQISALFVELKTEAPPSIPQAIKLVIDQVSRNNRNSRSVAAARTEDVSAEFGCLTGTVILNYDENANSASGIFTFSDCDIGGSGVFVNGTLPVEASWNDNTGDYRNQVGGTLTFDNNVDPVIIIVMNSIETGNDFADTFALTPNFSLDGIPGGGFLVTTAPPFTGDFVGVTGGESIVEGADSTRLCMLVTSLDRLTVTFDDGLGGGCVPLAPELFIDLT